jgi:peptidyl-tRNA hydrolase
MKDHDSSAAAASRASQEDPIVMYLVVRESLNMTTGKACAQVGHAVGMLMLKVWSKILAANTLFYGQNEECSLLRQKYLDQVEIFNQWMDGSFRKVVLSADDKEWEKIKTEFEVGDIVLVVDAGLTQIPSGSETVIGVWPMLKSTQPRVLKKLQVLK